MIPGSNILNMALGVIAKQTLTYLATTGRTPAANGVLQPTFAAGVPITGSFQPVPRSKYVENGLEFQKTYFNFYVPRNLFDIARDIAGDRLIFGGKTFQCVSKTPWYAIDGWDAILCVDITGNA